MSHLRLLLLLHLYLCHILTLMNALNVTLRFYARKSSYDEMMRFLHSHGVVVCHYVCSMCGSILTPSGFYAVPIFRCQKRPSPRSKRYADSSPGTLSEKDVTNDCIQLYQWVSNRTNAPIYIWGQSLGSALAADTVAALEKLNYYPEGLVLESAFTSLRDELYVHPYGKMFAWLPWFSSTILNPLRSNGFIFDTATNIANISSPIMILHAEDDQIVPYTFGRKLYEIAFNRSENSAAITFYHQFEKKLGYNHDFIYQDPYVKYFIMDFILAAQKNESKFVGSY